ncbi:MAG: DUF2116 family Zn-ribbon domain-containing protein [Promethearchaeota archaeon]
MKEKRISKKKSGAREKIFPHRHCSICFKMIPEYSDGYCSKECRTYGTKKDKLDKKSIIKRVASYAIVVGLMLILIVVFLNF